MSSTVCIYALGGRVKRLARAMWLQAIPRHAKYKIACAWTALVGVVGVSGLTGFIFGCAKIRTYRFEQEGWTPPVYNTVSEMITRNALCTDTFTAWLVTMMILTLAAVLWILSILFKAGRYSLSVILGISFVVAASGAGMVLAHPHIAESEYWEWLKSNSTEPFIDPLHSGTKHDIGAGLIMGGVLAVVGTVAWISRSLVAIGSALVASVMLGLLVGFHATGGDIYYYEYAFLYAAILTGVSAGTVEVINLKPPANQMPDEIEMQSVVQNLL